MSPYIILGLFILGIVAGISSGLVGIGGGLVVVPMLVMLFGFSQHTAQGTTLAMMVPPIGILAVLAYYQKGNVDIKTAAILCAGFVIGGYLGGKMALNITDSNLKKGFGLVMVLLGARMLLFSK